MMNAEYLITMKEETTGYGIKAYTQSVPEEAYRAVAAFLAGQARIVPNEPPADQAAPAEASEKNE